MFIQQHRFQQSLYQMITGFRHGFGARSIITTNPEHPSSNTIPPDFVGLSSLNGIAMSTLMQWESYFGYFFMYFLLSDGESPRWVKNAKVELVMKPQHPTSIGNTLVIQLFLTHCSHRSSYFSNLGWHVHIYLLVRTELNYYY